MLPSEQIRPVKSAGPDLYNNFEVTNLRLQFSGLSFALVLLCTLAPCDAQQKKQTFEERFAKAERYRINNDYPNALREFSSLIKVRPADSRMHARLGFVLVQVGNFPEAKKEIDRAIALNDEDPIAHQTLAMYDMLTGDRDGARAEYLKTIALTPGHNCHCGGVQAYLGITPDDEEQAVKDQAHRKRVVNKSKAK